MAGDATTGERAAARSRWPARLPGLAQVARVALVLAALWFFTRAVQRVAWAQVWQSVRDLSAWQVATLLAVLCVRQVVNAAPLALFVPGLGMQRALTNDLSANLTATVAPPPADLVLRLSMFRSWRVDTAIGLTGVTLNSLTYYIARFGAPVLGAALALAIGEYDSAYGVVALTGGLVAALVIAALAVASRSARVSAQIARLAGRAVHRFRPTVDPERWATWVEDFVQQASDRVRGRALLAAGCQFALVFTEALLLVMSLRFAGVGAAQATAALVVVALLVSYPLTALPLVGLGVLDAAILTILGLDHGPWEPEAVAGLIIWRACIQVVPLGAGALCVIAWRRSAQSDAPDGADAPDTPDTPDAPDPSNPSPEAASERPDQRDDDQ